MSCLRSPRQCFSAAATIWFRESVKRLRSRGLRVALDDFGTGYASLTHLQTFPVDVIKIDKCFVERLVGDSTGEVIVAALIDIARKLGMRTVAEGVETEAQATRLQELGCTLGQGFRYTGRHRSKRRLIGCSAGRKGLRTKRRRSALATGGALHSRGSASRTAPLLCGQQRFQLVDAAAPALEMHVAHGLNCKALVGQRHLRAVRVRQETNPNQRRLAGHDADASKCRRAPQVHARARTAGDPGDRAVGLAGWPGGRRRLREDRYVPPGRSRVLAPTIASASPGRSMRRRPFRAARG